LPSGSARNNIGLAARVIANPLCGLAGPVVGGTVETGVRSGWLRNDA
jgi:hypothetical protein